ncbi:hypothetical protein FVF58_09720 [Paraburkholderia panacisoli]|uniref:Lipoprotein n=1 Tax=Paraburkholderia panacisoli TaxID=2603818 RepID=A0A5B0HDD9_9BURK|nr:hypothetical protein [Paraburkholderia panacisoli]KAA1013058.1 hypothetical protein FVF58_09720 [Paraburkholderia panacisoli]
MLRKYAAFAAGFAVLAFSGCASNAPVKLTPAQFVAAVCPSVQQAFTIAPTLTALIPADAQTKIADAKPIVDASCAVGATISTDTPAKFVATVFPAVSVIVGAAPDDVLNQNMKAQIQGAILLAELGVGTVTAVANANAASAPVAASQ